jgi:hypothetical protein
MQYHRPTKKTQQHGTDLVMPVGLPAGAEAAGADSSVACAAPIEARGIAKMATSRTDFSLLMRFSRCCPELDSSVATHDPT